MAFKIKNEESGRSMVEILGVLAIIGILSVGGIAGYSKAMAKYKLTKTQDQLQLLTINIRSAFAGSASFENLDNISAIKLNIVPGEMLPHGLGNTTEVNKETGIVNAFSGGVILKAKEGDNQHFIIKFTGLGGVTCTSLASSDWGTEGLVKMTVSNGTRDIETYQDSLPLSATVAVNYCNGTNDQNSITWEYY